MKALHRRVVSARERIAGMRIEVPEPPAMEQWVAILKRVLPALEASDDPAAPAAVARVHRTVGLVAEVLGSCRPWAYLEYYCHACVLRMHWPSHVPAFLDLDYDRQIDEIEGIERGRSGAREQPANSEQ
jgi:hypothetical protein